MTHHHGEYVTIYDKNGNMEARGRIVGITHSNPAWYDIAPDKEFSLASRLCGIPAARIRRAYSQPALCEAMHIKDEA